MVCSSMIAIFLSLTHLSVFLFSAMTYQFFKTMMRFCFPEKDPETLDGESEHSDTASTIGRKGGGKSKGSHAVAKGKRGKESSFYVPIEDKDDVEKMKVNHSNASLSPYSIDL